MMIDRRQILIGGASLVFATSACAKPKADSFTPRLAALEKDSGGRLGVCILDTSSGRMTGHRSAERFTMCSTFKMPLAAAILARADAGQIDLDRMIAFTKADLISHSPVTEANLARGAMSVVEMAEAAQVESDNGAANLLLKEIGGPQALTAFFRAAGDPVTRLDRYEPELNMSHGSDLRDTTTPEATAGLVSHLFTGPILKPQSRDRLIQWMIATKTGTKRIRAGLPADWRAGDKTGTFTGDEIANKYNDVALVWHPGRPRPFVVTAYLESARMGGDMDPADQAVLANVGRVAADWIKAAA